MITLESGVLPSRGTHLCFRALDRESDCDAGFALDPDGHRVEAVCHAPEKAVVVRADAGTVVACPGLSRDARIRRWPSHPIARFAPSILG